jgi:hypothetical protein
MKTALLECPESWEQEHARPCITSLACWWREIRELEELLGYARSSLAARDVWDELLAAEILFPREALYVELRDCVRTWQRVSRGQGIVCPSLLERFVWVGTAEELPLPQYAVLVAFRLRQRLCGMRREISGSLGAPRRPS